MRSGRSSVTCSQRQRGGRAGLHIPLVVAENDGARQVARPFALRLVKQPRLRFAAEAAVVPVVQAAVDPIDIRSRLAQLAAHFFVNRVQIVKRHRAAGDARLVGKQQHRIARVFQKLYGLPRAGQPDEFLRSGHVSRFGRANVQRPVPVEKGEFARREKLPRQLDPLPRADGVIPVLRHRRVEFSLGRQLRVDELFEVLVFLGHSIDRLAPCQRVTDLHAGKPGRLPLFIICLHAPVRGEKQVRPGVAVAVGVGREAQQRAAFAIFPRKARKIDRAVVVAIHKKKFFVHFRTRRAQAQAGFVFDRRYVVFDLYAQARAVAEIADNFLRQVTEQQQHPFDAERARLLDQILQERFSLEGVHGFGVRIRKWAQARAVSSGEDDRLLDFVLHARSSRCVFPLIFLCQYTTGGQKIPAYDKIWAVQTGKKHYNNSVARNLY